MKRSDLTLWSRMMGGLLLAGLLSGWSQAPQVVVTRHPVVVELFTAQGCSGCPEANRLIEGLQRHPGVIALTYGVGYWDYLGWTDTFARPEFAARQQAYRQALQLRNVATPQIVIDGQQQVSMERTADLPTLIGSVYGTRNPAPDIEFRATGDRVGIGSGRPPAGGADVIAVIFKPGVQTVSVSRGDNQGQTVRHLNVVREIHRLGAWHGHPALYRLPAKKVPEDNLVILLQARQDQHILTAAQWSEPERD